MDIECSTTGENICKGDEFCKERVGQDKMERAMSMFMRTLAWLKQQSD